ncbi:hypothetical protein K470DRAFT_212063 [Piedraia hortae CBS 480.64]|uniref:Guanine nucleotide exchange factor Vps9 n=1 Tax=Piedraia hortae CBS 480.64 TaxID=1314780 RepID=A0A6A7C6W0_9PEZI|nr:hypothetical protein K470DRAFT_212063 [Piedraia hortae CBS 480.64]
MENVETAATSKKAEMKEHPPPPTPPPKDKQPSKTDMSTLAPQPLDGYASDLSAALPATEPAGTEIQTIMEQFKDEDNEQKQTHESEKPTFQLPPRTSSLEAKGSPLRSPQHPTSTDGLKAAEIFQPPPPEPEPSQPFDFHRFLEQLRHRTADPVARFLRSFLTEFGKKQWMVHEQVKIISDFLEFITKKMSQCEVWRNLSDSEFDNAKEGMEKLVMNRLYSQTFSPIIPPPGSSPRKGGKSRSQADFASPHGPGRRGQHQEDVERDEVLAQKMGIYGWIEEEHLDIRPIGEKGKRFLSLAQKELLKINTYRAPRDKVICVLNCCKVIFGFLKNAQVDQSADSFVPLLIYTVLSARPEHLVSNVQYIWRFRNQEKLNGEAGYYMSSLSGAVTFIENLDRTNLTISKEEFERNVERAVSAIAEGNRREEFEEKLHGNKAMQHLSEKSSLSRAEVTPRNCVDAEKASPRRSASERLGKESKQMSPGEDSEDSEGVSGLLHTIQKPLSSIGRILFDDHHPQQQLYPGNSNKSRQSPARQATPREHNAVVETLQSMFPNLDREVLEDVSRAQEGNVGRAVDACLALSGS